MNDYLVLSLSENNLDLYSIKDYKNVKASQKFIDVKESYLGKKTKSILLDIEAIHAILTGNYTRFTSDELIGNGEKMTGVYSWTYPYNKPMLTHHNSYNGEPIGRIVNARFEETTSANLPGIIVKAMITDEDAIEKFKDGRYDTVSIGARAGKAICSICGQDWVSEGYCGHYPGNTYEDEVAEIILGDIDFKELSVVNVPADKYAGAIRDSIVEIEESSKDGKDAERDESQAGIVTPQIIEEENTPDKGGVDERRIYVFTFSINQHEIGENFLDGEAEETKEKEDLKKGGKSMEDTKTMEELQKRVKELETELADMTKEKDSFESKYLSTKEELDDMTEELNQFYAERKKAAAEELVSVKIELGIYDESSEDFNLEDAVEAELEKDESLIKSIKEELQGVLEVKETEEVLEDEQDLEDPGKNKLKREGLVDDESQEEGHVEIEEDEETKEEEDFDESSYKELIKD